MHARVGRACPAHPTRRAPVRHSAATVHMRLYLQPLLMTCIMNLFHLYDCKPLHIHLLGKKIVRPWAAPQAANPLQQWAERKKAEAQDAQEQEAKKRS